MKKIKYTAIIIIIIIVTRVAYAADELCGGRESNYYVVDPQYFMFYDALNELKETQNFESREEYLNSIFGYGKWNAENKHFSFKAPSIPTDSRNIYFIENIINNKKEKTIIIIAELFMGKKLYFEIFKTNVNSEIKSYSTRFQFLKPGFFKLFVIHKHSNGTVLVSYMKEIKISGRQCTHSARTEDEENKLNTEICNAVPQNEKKYYPACERKYNSKL